MRETAKKSSDLAKSGKYRRRSNNGQQYYEDEQQQYEDSSIIDIPIEKEQ